MARCYYKLKEFDQSLGAFEKAIEAIKDSNLTDEAKTKLTADINKIATPLRAKGKPCFAEGKACCLWSLE